MAKRILRLTASPHAIAAGVAAGVFASFTPFFGFHFVIAFVISYIIAGNFIAAALGTFFGNPFTFPFIWASTFSLGRMILSGSSDDIGTENRARLSELTSGDIFETGVSGLLHELAGLWEPVVKPMMIGAIPIGIIVAIVAYLITRWIAIGFRAARKKRLASKANAIQKKAREAALAKKPDHAQEAG